MAIYQVQGLPNGFWDKKPFQKIEASSPKEAAEKLHGSRLSDRGSKDAIRARVRQMIGNTSNSIIFFES